MTYCLIDSQDPKARAVVDFPQNYTAKAAQDWAAQEFGRNMSAYPCPVATDKVLILCSTIANKKTDEDSVDAGIASDGGDVQPADHEDDLSAFEAADEGQIL